MAIVHHVKAAIDPDSVKEQEGFSYLKVQEHDAPCHAVCTSSPICNKATYLTGLRDSV